MTTYRVLTPFLKSSGPGRTMSSLVQFVMLLHAATSCARAQDGELAKPPILLSQA